MTPLTLTTATTASGPVIALAGELDCDTAPTVRQALTDLTLARGQQLILDLGAVTFCDSSGISTFVAALNLTQAAHAGLALTAVPDRVQHIFGIVGLDRVLTLHPTITAATRAWTTTSATTGTNAGGGADQPVASEPPTPGSP